MLVELLFGLQDLVGRHPLEAVLLGQLDEVVGDADPHQHRDHEAVAQHQRQPTQTRVHVLMK